MISPAASTITRLGKTENQIHVMLDHQHGEIGRQLRQCIFDQERIAVRHARRRFVQQQHLWPQRHRQRNFQKALLAIGDLADRDPSPVPSRLSVSRIA